MAGPLVHKHGLHVGDSDGRTTYQLRSKHLKLPRGLTCSDNGEFFFFFFSIMFFTNQVCSPILSGTHFFCLGLLYPLMVGRNYERR